MRNKPQLIEGALTILCSKEEVVIEVSDKKAATMFTRILLTPENFTAALGRLAYVPCKEMAVKGLDKVGKIHECKKFEFEMPVKLGGSSLGFGEERDIAAKKESHDQCPDGWVSDGSFNSQGSFFSKGDVAWARTTIRRWVEPKDSTTKK